jgi:hypothetical protein
MAYTSALKMEANFQQTIRHYVPEDRTLQNSNMFVVGAGGCLMKGGLEGKPGSSQKSCVII